MTILTPDKQSDTQLVASILGKRSVDEECILIAGYLARDGNLSEPSIRRDKRIKLEASIELGKRMLADKMDKPITLSTPKEVVRLMKPHFKGVDKEVFYCLCLNTKNHLIKMVEVSIGSLNASIVHPRELYKQAIACSTASVIVVHNHPSGDPTPSGADLQLTRRLARAGEVLGIELLDHVVVGKGDTHESLRDMGAI